jgi:agmatine/peptidylarginine deiminase
MDKDNLANTHRNDAVTIMMNSINEDNRKLCLSNGLTEEEADQHIDNAQASLGMIMYNMYDKLVEAKVIVV